MPRYSTRFKFSIGQPNEKGEYYLYRHDKKSDIIVAYKMDTKTNKITKITETNIPKHGFNEFKTFQEIIEKRKFNYTPEGIKTQKGE